MIDSLVIQVRDSRGNTAQGLFSIPIISPGTLNITTSSPLPGATQGVAYSYTMAATGGVTPYTWSLVSDVGSNNTWSVSSAGVLTGTPGTAETDTLVIKVVDNVGTPASGNFNLQVSANVQGYDGSLQLLVSGQIANGHSNAIMLRGMNLVGLDAQIMGGICTSNQYWSTNPWGNTSHFGSVPPTGPTGPSFPAIATWKPNCLRFGINPQAFANYSVSLPVWGGSVASSTWQSGAFAPQAVDPHGIYKQTVLNAILGCRSINCYMIVSCGITAPQFTLGGVTNWMAAVDQPPFLDYASGYPFWCTSSTTTSFPAWLATNFGSAAFNTANGFNGGAAGAYYSSAHGGSTGINDVIFELFNEPYLTNQAFTFYEANADGTQSGTLAPATPSAQLNGNLTYTTGAQYVKLIGGWCSWFYQQGNGAGIPAAFTSPANTNPSNPGGLPNALALPWRILGYQPCTNAIRAMGFTNVIQVNGDAFAHTYQELPYIMPVDTMSPPQISLGNHPYPTAYNSNTSYPANSDVNTASQWKTYANELLAGTLSVTAPSWTTGWSAGRVVPIVMDEWSDESGAVGNVLSTSQYIQQLENYADTNTLGLVGLVTFGWQSPDGNGAPGPYTFALAEYATSISFTGSIATGSPAVMTVTTTPTGTLSAGMVNQNNGGYIIAQLSGAAGGVGTYSISVNQAYGSQTLTFAMPVPYPAGGSPTIYNWMQPHS